MDFELSDDQVALRDEFRRLLEGRYPMEFVRSLEGVGVDRARWRELAEAGVFSLAVPEAEGGVGLGWAEAVLAFEELGRAAVPGPLIGSFLSATLAGLDGLAGDLATQAAAGDAVVTVVPRVEGVHLVECLASADAVVVVDEAGLWLVDPDVIEAEPLERPLDPWMPLHRVVSLPPGELLAGPQLAARWAEHGRVLAAAYQLGLSDAALWLGVEYAKQRQQFGKPIGAFQAVKHLLADSCSRVEVARAAVYAAGCTLDTPEVGDVERTAAVAKILADDAAVENGKACVQVHGGMGYTWEVDAHVYLKRAWLLATVFGTVEQLDERVAELI